MSVAALAVYGPVYLIVDGKERELGADWAIRFVENPLLPVLYYKGKRVTKAWSLAIGRFRPVKVFDSPQDPYDENANTADI